MIHVITETACHTGHLDAARELIDGTTWLSGSPISKTEAGVRRRVSASGNDAAAATR